jgi:hypothetical protein
VATPASAATTVAAQRCKSTETAPSLVYPSLSPRLRGRDCSARCSSAMLICDAHLRVCSSAHLLDCDYDYYTPIPSAESPRRAYELPRATWLPITADIMLIPRRPQSSVSARAPVGQAGYWGIRLCNLAKHQHYISVPQSVVSILPTQHLVVPYPWNTWKACPFGTPHPTLT